MCSVKLSASVLEHQLGPSFDRESRVYEAKQDSDWGLRQRSQALLVRSEFAMRRGNGTDASPRHGRGDDASNVARESICMCLIRSR